MSYYFLLVEMKSVQASSMANTKAFEIPSAINLKPPPMERHKSFDDDDFSAKPVVPKKVTVAPANAISYSIADLQIATDSFSADNLIGEGSTGRVFRAQFEDGKVYIIFILLFTFTLSMINITQRIKHNLNSYGYCRLLLLRR